MKNNLNNEEQLLRDKLNQTEAEFNYQESDWLEIQQKLPKKGALSNFSTLLKAGSGFAILVTIAYLINISWNNSAPNVISQNEKMTDVEANTSTIEQPSNELNEKLDAQENLQLKNRNTTENKTLPAVESKEQTNRSSEEKSVEPNKHSEKEQKPIAEDSKETNSNKTQTQNPPLIELKSINVDGKVCVGSTVELSPIISGENLNELSYKWEVNGVEQKTNEASLNYNIQQSGLLRIVLSAMSGNKLASEHEMELAIPEVIKADFTYQDLESPYNDFSADFTASSENIEGLRWEIQDIDSTLRGSNAKFNFGRKGVFDVKLICSSKNGCNSSISKPVFIDQDFETLAPNAFTPDGNDLNEAFIPVGFTPEAGVVKNDEFRMSIYDYNGKFYRKA